MKRLKEKDGIRDFQKYEIRDFYLMSAAVALKHNLPLTPNQAKVFGNASVDLQQWAYKVTD
jgi:predicted nucleic acid-binding protein